MINPKELRIGNLTNFGEVIEIHQTYFYVRDEDGREVSSNLEDIQPILLTEEWLFRFGFMERTAIIDDGSKRVYRYGLNDFYISRYGGKTYSLFNDYPAACHFIAEIKYVHTLQNSWLDLTEIDLKHANL